MSILSAQTIRYLCLLKPASLFSENEYWQPLIAPFHERTVLNGKTFGLSSCGYDIRVDLGEESEFSLPPGYCHLAVSMEKFCIPKWIVATIHDKSSWARRFLTVQNTIAEPGWYGYLTLEIVNHSQEYVTIKHGDPIAQMMFTRLDTSTEQPYEGKYQNQPHYAVGAIDEPDHA